MEYLSDDMSQYVLRLIGRIGFCLLILVLYRLYRFIASPLLRQHNKKFVFLFGMSILVGFVLMWIEYLFPASWPPNISILFNVLTTYVLTVYLHFQVRKLESSPAQSQFEQLRNSMDAVIISLKANR